MTHPTVSFLSNLFDAAPRSHRPSLLDRLALRRQRRHLGDLEPHLLADIGLSDREAAGEAARPVWDVPKGWRSGC